MMQSDIGSIQECGVALTFEEFSHLSSWYFGLSSLTGLEAL